jgi:uncharacterized membrane protein
MRLWRIVQRHGLGLPVLALVVASIVSTGLVGYRVLTTRSLEPAYLVWNLFLAWLPLGFALLAAERLRVQVAAGRTAPLRDHRLIGLGVAWLLFFPNAPYIFTDIVHVRAVWVHAFWVDLMLILFCALTGFLAGVLSLQVMHGWVTRLWGWRVGWLFVAGVSGLAGFGVYLGRFVRLNSWNVLTHPVRVLEGVGHGAWHLATQWSHAKFVALFSLFLLLGYGMLFAMTQQRRDQVPGLEESN